MSNIFFYLTKSDSPNNLEIMSVIIVFKSVHFTIKADKLFQKNHLVHQVITTPRELSTDCGMSLEIDEEILAEAEIVLKNNDLDFKIFKRE